MKPFKSFITFILQTSDWYENDILVNYCSPISTRHMDKNKNEIPQMFTLEKRKGNIINRKEFIKCALKAGTLTVLGSGFLVACEKEEGLPKTEDINKSMKYDYILHSGYGVDGIQFDAAGDELLTIGRDEVRSWSLPQGILLKTEKIEQFVSTCFNMDNSLVVTGHVDNTIKVWKIPEIELLRSWNAESRYVGSMCLSPDNKILATGGQNKVLKLWDFESGVLLHAFPATGGIKSVCFSPDGKYIIAGGEGLYIRNMETKELYKSFSDSYIDVEVSPDGKYLAAGSLLMSFPECNFIKHIGPGEGNIMCLEFSPDSKILFCGFETRKRVDGLDRRLGSFRLHLLDSDNVWDFDGFDYYIKKGTFSPDNTVLAIGDGAGIVSLYGMPDVVKLVTEEYCTCDTICICNSVAKCSCNSNAPCGCNTVCTINMVCSCNYVCPSDSMCLCISH